MKHIQVLLWNHKIYWNLTKSTEILQDLLGSHKIYRIFARSSDLIWPGLIWSEIWYLIFDIRHLTLECISSGGSAKRWLRLTREGGWVWKPTKLANIICGQPKDQMNLEMAAAVKLLLCLFSLTASNISCFALVSFFLTTLPNQRNLLTFFDIVLVLALTCLVDIGVRMT